MMSQNLLHVEALNWEVAEWGETSVPCSCCRTQPPHHSTCLQAGLRAGWSQESAGRSAAVSSDNACSSHWKERVSSLEAAQHQDGPFTLRTAHFVTDWLDGKATIIKTVIPDVTELCSLKLFNWQWPVEQFCAATESLSAALQWDRLHEGNVSSLTEQRPRILLIWDYRTW